MLRPIFFILFIFIPFFLEGLGIWVDRRIFLLYYSSIPSFFYIYTSFIFKKIKIPLMAGLLYFLFLFFSAISTLFFSLDKHVSFELFFLHYSSFLLFLFFYNFKKSTVLLSCYLPIILGFLFTVYSFLLPFFKSKGFTSLIPLFEKQFVFASYTNHNHLGDFLGLLVLVTFYYLIHKKWSALPFFLFFFGIMMLSFSRSAYLAFFIVFILILFFYRKNISTLILPFVLFILSLMLFATFIISIQVPINSPFYKIQTLLKTSLDVSPRETISARDIYFKQAFISINKYPFFGIGSGNFLIASKSNVISSNSSDSAHNIILELATEQGLFATIFFLLFIFLITKHALTNSSLSGFLFLYLLINFQTDYTYQVYSLFLFWIILSSLSYSEKNEIEASSSLYGLLCIVPLVILVCISTSSLLLKIGNIEGANNWYPLSKDVYVSAIKKQDNKSSIFIARAEQIAPYDLNIIIESANYYITKGNKQKALSYYERVYSMNKLCSFYFIKRIYTLKKEVQSKKIADSFLKGVVLDYEHIFATDVLRKEFSNFCREEKITPCLKIGWNE